MRRIRTKRESLSGVAFGLLFSAIWYSIILKNILAGQAMGNYIIFLIAGLLPLYTSLRQIRRAVYYRKLHEEYQKGRARKGRIIDCVKQYRQTAGSRGRIRMVPEYVLHIELENENGLRSETIQSEPYSWPVYRVLSSPEVDVYTDESGWNHVIDGFHYRKRGEPGFFRENPFEKAPGGEGGRFVYIIALILMVLMLGRIVFG